MLHELLLALSGHASPLLEDGKDLQQFGQLLSPSEAALLRSIATLGNLHIAIRRIAIQITETHRSVVCRAVSKAIECVHLARFQQDILTIESKILREDASLVGAYNNVPLSSIVTAFGDWKRKLQWLQIVVRRMQPGMADRPEKRSNGAKSNTSGAQIIDWLRKETHTGYPDIEQLALDLVGAAERIWLRQVSAWVLYSSLPTMGAEDFLIQQDTDVSNGQFKVRPDLSPDFVTPTTANSILFIGRSLDYLRYQRKEQSALQSFSPDIEHNSLLSSHVKHLSSLKHPINSVTFAIAIGNIRSSISQNILQKLLPLPEIRQVLALIHNFFLLGHGDFAIALIAAADECLAARNTRALGASSQRDAHRFGGMMIKEGEVKAVLSRTWAKLAALQSDHDDDTDEELDQARDLIQFSIKRPTTAYTGRSFLSHAESLPIMESVKTTFEDVLLATPTSLSIAVSSPLDLFLSGADVEAYTTIHSYLLAIRRAHLHLTDLWKLSTLRRAHSFPHGPPTRGMEKSKLRLQANDRSIKMRSTWASINSAAFFLAELGEYFQGEVVSSSWDQFSRWLQQPTVSSSSRPGSSNSTKDISSDISASESASRDPESLAVAHRLYLSALIHSLILDDATFAKSLRQLLSQLDHIVALVKQLDTIHLTLETQQADNKLPADEDELMNNLQSIRTAISTNLRSIADQLSSIDTHGLGAAINIGQEENEVTDFVPWRGAGLHRLLMKLDFLRLGERWDGLVDS
jgi:hypothetical protein